MELSGVTSLNALWTERSVSRCWLVKEAVRAAVINICVTAFNCTEPLITQAHLKNSFLSQVYDLNHSELFLRIFRPSSGLYTFTMFPTCRRRDQSVFISYHRIRCVHNDKVLLWWFGSAACIRLLLWICSVYWQIRSVYWQIRSVDIFKYWSTAVEQVLSYRCLFISLMM